MLTIARPVGVRGIRAVAIAVCLVLSAGPARALDEARIEANVAAAIAKYGVSGTGVVVAILDRGIDWTNNDFRNPDGTTRIAAILDLTDDTGAHDAGNPYGMGTLYTRSQIDAALLGGTPLAIRDAVGHGTATAGIAVGNGRNSVAGRYRGIAPNATIIIVKITSDGAPAHDDQLEEAPFYDPSRIPVAIDFVKAQASALGMPCVMLLNLGSQGGPTDGSSSLARKIDAVVGPGIPGLVFVTGTGDDGGSANRAGGNVVAGGDSAIRIQKGTSGPLYFDLWYGRSDRFDVTIQGPSGTSGPYVSPPSDASFDTQNTTDFVYYHLGSDLTFFGPQTNKREILIQFTGAPGTYTVTLHRSAIAGDGRFDATLNPSQIWNPPYNTNRFLNFVSPGSLWDAAAARNNIAPNAYTFRTSWIDIDGISRTLTGNGNPGEIWPGSSVGPTLDGRLGVDVSAPGEEVVTAYAPKSYWATFRSNLVNDGNGLYGLGGGVSAAAPMVTGVIALMLEMNPTLDAAQVKSLLHRARVDAFTGAVPNTTWGYGKLDALRVLDTLSANATTFTTLAVDTTMAPPGSPVMLTLANGAGGPTDWVALATCTSPLTTYVNWFYAGAGVTSHTWPLTLPTTLGCYEFRLFSNNGFTLLAQSPSITVANINATPAITAISPSSIAAGSAAVTLTVSGTGFAPGAVVQVDGDARSTTYVSATKVTAVLLADDVANEGISDTITVVNPSVCVGSVCTSNGATLDVIPPPPPPAILTIDPPTVTAGSPEFTLTVSGTNFTAGSVVRVNGSPRVTTFGSSTLLTATIPASDIASGTVSTAFSGSISLAWDPSAGAAGYLVLVGPAPGLYMRVVDVGDQTSAVIDGLADRQTYYFAVEAYSPLGDVSDLSNEVSGAAPSTTPHVTITVATPAPGGGTSNGVALTVIGPVLSVSAATVPVAGPVQTTFSNGPGRPSEWVALFPANTSGATGYVDWQWTTGGQAMPGTATSGTLTFPTAGKVLAPGTYVFRWISAGAVLAQSAPVAFQVISPTPTITTISPNGIAAGSALFELTVTGTGFVSGTVVQVDGSARPTTFASATQLLAALPAADVTTAGTTRTITVVNPPACVGSVCTSNGVPLTVTTPPAAPTLTSITPTNVAAGGAAFVLTVTGTSFAGNSVVQVNGVTRTTTFVSVTSLTASVPASDIASGGTLTITVFTPAPGGGTSNSLPLTVVGPGLTVSATTVPVAGPVQVTFANGPGNGNEWIGLYPASGVAGFADWQWTTGGQGAHGTATTGTLTFPTGGRTLPPGNYVFRWISATNTILAQSPVMTFAVLNATPTIAAITPSSIAAGSAAFPLSVTGTGFVSGAVVQVDGSPRTTTFVSAAQVTAAMLASDVTTAGTSHTITVVNPPACIGSVCTSNGVPLNVTTPPAAPALASITPTTVAAGGPAFALAVTGTDFAGNSVVQVNGVTRTTTFGSATSLTATVPASEIASGGTLTIRVVTPAPGGGTSNSTALTVVGPTLTVSATTVPVAGPVQTTFSNGPGRPSEWVALFPASTGGITGYVDWQWTTGGQAVAGTATSGTLTFPTGGKVLAPGTYVFRWISASTVLAQSAPVAFQVINPTPTITTINPNGIAAGSAAFALTVTGTGFVNGAVVLVDGSARPTTFGSATQLLAALPAGDVTTAGSCTITVVNPSACVGSVCTSNGATLNVTTPPTAPALTAISPTSVAAGGAAFTLTVTGTDFAGNSVVQVNGVTRTTTFGSATSLTAIVPASDIASGGTLTITVVTPAPGGGTSNSTALTVVGPTLTVSATTVPVAGPVQTTFSNGPGRPSEWVALFPASTGGITGYVDWQWTTGGQAVAGTATSGTLTFPTGGKVLAPGTYVFRWISAGAVLAQSAPVAFQVINPTPTITTINPNGIAAGSAAFALTVTGTGFVNGAVVRVDGSARPTTFGSATQLLAALPAGDVTTAGTSHTITVVNPPACVGSVCTSNGVPLNVTTPPAAPTLTAISPTSVTAGGAAFTLTVTGTDFASNSVVQVNGVSRTTTFGSATSLTAAVPASDIASGGTLTITVVTPAPGGGTSNSTALTVVGPTLTVSATTVPLAGPVQVTFTNGPGNNNEWIGLYPASGVAGFADWQWITGGQAAHGTATTGTLTFPTGGRPLPPGNYVFRWISSTNTILAQSPVVTFAINPTP